MATVTARSNEIISMPIRSSTLVALLASALAAPCALAAGSGASQGKSGSAAASAPAPGSMTSPQPASGAAVGGASTARGGSGMYGSYYGLVPPPDPNRKISVQDCTKPIVADGGNLLCK